MGLKARINEDMKTAMKARETARATLDDVRHVRRVLHARGAEVPAGLLEVPLMYQGGSDDLLGPRDPIVCASEAFGIDFEAEVAVITSDMPMGCSPERALDGIRLVKAEHGFEPVEGMSEVSALIGTAMALMKAPGVPPAAR